MTDIFDTLKTVLEIVGRHVTPKGKQRLILYLN
jgi:hypothetical protein